MEHYNDLSNKPSLFSGAYADLSGKPTLGTAAATATGDFATAAQGALAASALQEETITLTEFKSVVAASSDFDDFKTRGSSNDMMIFSFILSLFANHLPVMYVQVPQWADDWAVCAVDIPDAKCHWYVMAPDNTFGEGFSWEDAPWFDANGLNDVAPMQEVSVLETTETVMATPTSKAELKEYALRRLGKPVLEINVSDDQVDDAIDYTLQKFQQYHYDGAGEVLSKT